MAQLSGSWEKISEGPCNVLDVAPKTNIKFVGNQISVFPMPA